MRLYEKYRPRSLSSVVGQPCVAELRAFVRSPYPCCFLFVGSGGIGKTSAALAMAADLGAEDECSGLIKIKAADLDVATCRELFDRSLRLRPMFGSEWHVLVIEELERVASAAVSGFLKVALDAGELPTHCVVIATSNSTKSLDRALMQRFVRHDFAADAKFAVTALGLVKAIWSMETEAPLPYGWQSWGWSGEGKSREFSLRSALDMAQRSLLMSAEEVACA